MLLLVMRRYVSTPGAFRQSHQRGNDAIAWMCRASARRDAMWLRMGSPATRFMLRISSDARFAYPTFATAPSHRRFLAGCLRSVHPEVPGGNHGLEIPGLALGVVIPNFSAPEAISPRLGKHPSPWI
jgi:hypothetical protein